MQLILLVETNKTCNSDFMYINDFIKAKYFILGIKISPIYLSGKCNYDSQNKKITAKKEAYQGESVVILCIDLNKQNINYDQVILNEKITQYCIKNGYELICFNRDIEEVFIGVRIKQKEKKQRAEKFLRLNEVAKIDDNKMYNEYYSQCASSNIGVILNKYLKRKTR